MTELKVLDHGLVRLVSHHGNDALIVRAARTSYGDGTKSVREDAALIDYLVRHQHTSPLELVNFTFHLKMPIFVARQWQRHRTARLNEISGRYSVMKDEFYIPEGERVQKQSGTNKQGSGEPFPPDEARDLRMGFGFEQDDAYGWYEARIERGMARELARINLPLSLYTEMYWQMDLHNLLHFLKLRLDAHAQYEIRVFAGAIAELIQPIVPVTWGAWVKHVLHAKTFSSDEMAVIKDAMTIWRDRPAHDPEDDLETLARESGMKKTRVREFMAKFGELA